jgi:N-acetylmuramoyl-L-alanine amidase
MYGASSNFVNTIALKNHTDGIGTTIELELLRGNYHYDISLSPDKLSLNITVYYNAITNATIGTNSNGDYLIVNSTNSMKPVVSDSNGCITIDLPDTMNGIGNITSIISGSKYISQFLTFNTADRTQLVMTLKDGYKYYCKESGSRFTISFQPKNAPVTDQGEYEVVIPKPSEITSSMISDTDHYFNNYFVIHINGNYTSQITADRIKTTSSVVDDVTVSLNDNGNTEIKISTSKLQGYAITSDKDNIYIHIGDPSDIYKNIEVLDPGHGGAATGAIKDGNYEKDINFQILYTVGKKYFNQDTSKLKVYYTRTSDTDVSLDDRAAFADKIGADLFVSLHMNAAPNATSACGTEVFYSDENNAANDAGLTSKELASLILSNLYPAIGTSKRGVKEGGLVVTKKNSVPAVLIELGFLTNSKDYSIIMDEEKQEIAAKSIYYTLLQIFESYPTGR